MPECAARRQSNVRDGPPRTLALIMATAPGDADLAAHRAAIDALDREILARLNARAEHAQAIGALKAGGVVVPARARGAGAAPAAGREPRPAVQRGGRRRVPAGDVGVHGARAAVAHRLPRPRRARSRTRRWPSTSAASCEASPARRSTRCSARVESGQTDYAVVPVENSTEGAVGRTLDLMCQTPLLDLRRDQAARDARTC